MGETFYCAKCKKRIPKYLKKRHEKGHFQDGVRVKNIPSMNQSIGKMFFKRIYDSDDVYVLEFKKDMLIFPKYIYFSVVYQQIKPLREDIPLPLESRQIKIKKKHTKSFIQQCMKGNYDRVYARINGVTFSNQDVFPTIKFGPISIWVGGSNSIFQIHRDPQLLSLNYVHKGGPKIWWIIKKRKQKMFERIMRQLFQSDIIHPLEHPYLWINGDQLSKQYPQLDIIRIEQKEGYFVHLARYNLYHWGINLNPIITEIMQIRNNHSLRYPKECKVCHLF